MAAEPSASKKRRLDPETSVKEEISPGANEDTASRDEQTSGGELEKRSDFWEPFKRLFNSPDHSDVKICAQLPFGAPEFYGHSFVLRIRCPRLTELQKSTSLDKDLIWIPGDYCAVRRMLEYIYTGDYSVDYAALSPALEPKNKLIRHARTYALARKYELGDLRALCYEKCAKDWDCGSFCQSVFYDLNPLDQDEMRFLIGTAINHADELLTDEKFVDALVPKRTSNNLPYSDLLRSFVRKLLLRQHTSDGSESTL
ncbi:hypothetical protein DTO212C5_1334 [Paecilomyces variotii]|nr:hypothetical protein DTO212C5_1334 [Paecilomyces variotii]